MKVLSFAVLALSLLAPVSSALATGAFAVSTERGEKAGDEGYGIGWGSTREEASAEAMRECRGAGNDNCKVVAWFETCGAYASNRTSYGVGWGRTEEAAKEMAQEKCPNCKIVLSDCE